MAYEKQNLKNGEILPADKLNHIEDGIVDLENSQAKIDDLNVTTDKAWSSRRIIDTLCPSIDETGNPVVFYPVAGYPLGCKVSWEPTQEGSGDPSPDNVRPIKGRDTVKVERCGGNVIEFLSTYDSSSGIKIAVDAEKNITLNGTLDGKGNISIGMCRLHWVAGKNYTMYVKKVGGSASLGSGDGITFAYSLFTTDYNHYFRGDTNSTNLNAYIARDVALVETELIFMLQCWRDGTKFDNYKFQIEVVEGTTAPTTYAPYTGQTATLTMPRTIYGGTVDAVTGEGQETWKLVTLDGTRNWETWGVNKNNAAVTGFYNYGINDYDPNGNKLLCSTMPYKNVDVWGGRNEGIGYASALNHGSRYVIYSVKTDTLSDASDNASAVASFKSYLAAQYAAGTPVQIAYKLATPTPFTATGAQPISALSGVNTVLTDADNVTVTGRAMPEKNRNQNLSTDILFKYPRTGKVYTVKIPKFTSNPATVCEKLDDNTGLVCEASTDTIEGRDDYAEIPLFKWYNCNYKRDENGHAYPIAIEGFNDNYTTSGNIDVGVIQMTPFVKWDDSNDDYIILSITDIPTEGYRAWSTARVGGEVYPYVIHSKYISSLGTDGLLHSIPNAKPERNQSYNNMITNYAKKGSGYKGAGVERNTWQIIFTLIKYANKSSQNIFAGTTGYSFQYSASIQSAEKHTYFPVTNAQAANIIIGGYVSVGYAYKTSDTATNLDRGYDTVHSYADSVKVLKIEDLDDSNKAVYLDVKEGFDTIQHEYSDTLSAPITLTSIHWYSGSTDSIMGHHDGSFVNNNNSKYPYRVQGVEYAVGGYTVASDTVIVFTDNNEKDVYVSPSNIAHSSDDATIKSNYKNVGHIPSGEWWIGDIGFDTDMNATWPTVRGSGNATGVGDYNYGSTGNNGITREYLQGGHLGYGSYAGSSYLDCWYRLWHANWYCLSAD